MKYNIFFVLAFTLCVGSLISQPALHLRHLPGEIGSQAYQPAYLAMTDSAKIRVGGSLGYGVGSNVLFMDQVFLESGLITEATKEAIVNQLGEDNRIQLGLAWEGAINFRVKNQIFSVFTRQLTHTHLAFHDPASLGLVLYGNARYAGQTLTDEDIAFGLTTYQEIGVGSAWQFGRLSAGIRLKALFGNQANILQQLNYSLFTEELGTRIDVQSNYQFFRAQTAGTPGIGFGVDLGAVYNVRPNLSLQIAVQDLGTIRWQGELYEQQIDINYEGVEVSQLFDIDLNNTSNFLPSDTLRTLLIAEPKEGTFSQNLPTQISIGAAYSWKRNNQLFATLLYGFQPSTFSNPLPLLNIAYHRKLGSVLTLGLNGYGGGLDLFGIGALARADMKFGSRVRMSIFANMDNAVGAISPANGNGFSFQGGLTLGMN